MTTDQAVIDAFIRGARSANIDRYNMSRKNTDTLTKLYSSTAMVDSSSNHGKEPCSCDTYKIKR